MGRSQQRASVLNDFHTILSECHAMTHEEANVKYYGDISLCASVNSVTYEDTDSEVTSMVSMIESC
ncbi:unnamed protein product, partial [Rotaria magnacalcarata]